MIRCETQLRKRNDFYIFYCIKPSKKYMKTYKPFVNYSCFNQLKFLFCFRLNLCYEIFFNKNVKIKDSNMKNIFQIPAV